MREKRWISLLVENEVGVLAYVSGLFSGKSYNLDSLTVGVTEDVGVSRMTIGLTSDDKTFEQIKKQLNRSVEVIKVIDWTDAAIHMKELMFLRVTALTEKEQWEVSRALAIFDARMIDCDARSVLIQCVQTEERNNDLIRLFEKMFGNRLEIVRGGSVAVEAISISGR